MTLSHDQLQAFYEVTRLGSFTKAAQGLGLTQSALSHRIRNLEGQLETALFIRDTAGVRLTEAGTKLLRFCRVQSQIETEFMRDFKTESRQGIGGYLRIGGASTVMWSVVTPALGPLLRENPEIQIEMLSRELSALPRLLNTGQIDFIIMCGKLELPRCEEIYLGDERSVLVESKRKNARAGIYLDHDSEDRTTFEYLRFQGDKKEIERGYMDNIQGILAGVAEGFGRAVVPLHLLTSTDLQRVRGHKEYRVPVYLYYLKQPYYTKLHKETLDALRKGVGKLLGV